MNFVTTARLCVVMAALMFHSTHGLGQTWTGQTSGQTVQINSLSDSNPAGRSFAVVWKTGGSIKHISLNNCVETRNTIVCSDDLNRSKGAKTPNGCTVYLLFRVGARDFDCRAAATRSTMSCRSLPGAEQSEITFQLSPLN
jgi:hypothetical protein